MEEGRLTTEEECLCQAALAPGAETVSYVCCKLYMYLGGDSAVWEDTGLVGPLFIVRHCGVYYLALVELQAYTLKMVHELHFPLEVKVLNSHFYMFQSELLAAIVGIKACEGSSAEFLAALSQVVCEQGRRAELDSNAGAVFASAPSTTPQQSESQAELGLLRQPGESAAAAAAGPAGGAPSVNASVAPRTGSGADTHAYAETASAAAAPAAAAPVAAAGTHTADARGSGRDGEGVRTSAEKDSSPCHASVSAPAPGMPGSSTGTASATAVLPHKEKTTVLRETIDGESHESSGVMSSPLCGDVHPVASSVHSASAVHVPGTSGSQSQLHPTGGVGSALPAAAHTGPRPPLPPPPPPAAASHAVPRGSPPPPPPPPPPAPLPAGMQRGVPPPPPPPPPPGQLPKRPPPAPPASTPTSVRREAAPPVPAGAKMVTSADLQGGRARLRQAAPAAPHQAAEPMHMQILNRFKKLRGSKASSNTSSVWASK